MGIINMNMEFFKDQGCLEKLAKSGNKKNSSGSHWNYSQQFKILEFMKNAPPILDSTFLFKPQFNIESAAKYQKVMTPNH